MDSPRSNGSPFFESSEGGEISIPDVSMEDDHAQGNNFRGLPSEESMMDYRQTTDDFGSILPDRLPDLSGVLAREAERRKKRGGRKIKKNEYDEIIDELQKYGETHGFIDDYLLLIWELVSTQTSALNCAQRRRMIFQMLPDHQVGHKVINTILYWLKEAIGCKPTVLTAVYQLLNLYFENRLDDDSEIISTNTINCILTARTENFIIPWKTRLFRNIVTPENLSLGSINALKKLLETKDIKKTQRDDIYATLGLCKHMRPDLFSEDDDLPSWKMRTLNFPEDALQRFHDAKVRIQEERPARHPLEDRIFPEFLPDWNTSSTRKTILMDMLANLDSDENTAYLAMNPVLLHVFEEWLKPVLKYRFHHFSGASSEEDRRRYRFILLKIEHITKVRQEGLKVMNEWLVNFLCGWGFWIYDHTIMTLLAYVPPHDILQCGEMLGNKLLNQFRYSSGERVYIWKILENWFFGWTEAVAQPIDGGGDESSLAIISIVDSRKWLLKLMCQCADATMFTVNDSGEVENLRIHFSNFINSLHVAGNQIDFHKDETMGVIKALSSKLICLEKMSTNVKAMGLD